MIFKHSFFLRMLLGLVSSSSSMAEQQQQETNASTAIKPECILFTDRVALIQSRKKLHLARVTSSTSTVYFIERRKRIGLSPHERERELQQRYGHS